MKFVESRAFVGVENASHLLENSSIEKTLHRLRLCFHLRLYVHVFYVILGQRFHSHFACGSLIIPSAHNSPSLKSDIIRAGKKSTKKITR